MERYTKRNKKDIKNNLIHLNDVYIIFKLESIKDLGEVNKKYIQKLLKLYIEDNDKIYEESHIEQAINELKEIDE
jgi:hypothetical protein